MRLIITAIFCLLSFHVIATNYYVSNTGNDLATGTSDLQAWRTIARVNAASLTSSDAVYLKAGSVFNEELRIPTNGFKLYAYGTGEKPLITGLTEITGWSDLGGGIYESSPVSLSELVDVVTINGIPVAPGRFPNSGYLTYQSGTSTSITSSSLTGTPNYTGAEAVIRKIRWVTDRSLISSQSGSTINFLSGSANPTAGFGFFLQKFPSALDSFGEWYYTGSAIRIYFGSNNPASYSVKAANLDTIINVGNKSNVIIDGIEISGSQKFGIWAYNANTLTVQNCRINATASAAIFIHNTPNLLVESNQLNNNLNNGIQVNNNTVSGYTKIRSNTIYNTGQIAGLGASSDKSYIGIYAAAPGLLIELNKISNTGYNAIDFNNSNVVVRYNEIDTFCNVKDDGGGIYTWGRNCVDTFTNRAILSNIIKNAIGVAAGSAGGNGQAKGIYLDGGTANVSVRSNTIVNSVRSGLLGNNIRNCTISNNTFINHRFGIELVRRHYNDTTVTSGSQTRVLNTRITGNLISGNFLNSSGSSDLGFSFYEENLSTSWKSTIIDDVQQLGVLDSNTYSYNSPAPFDYEYSLTAGGSIIRPASLSITDWSTLSGFESSGINSNFSPELIVYNPSESSADIELTGTWQNRFGSTYTGIINLQPYRSELLREVVTLPANTIQCLCQIQIVN